MSYQPSQQFVVTDASPEEYFIAQRITDGVVANGNVYIAKPLQLRVSTFDGITHDVDIEYWNGVSVDILPKEYSYDYKTATLRIKTDSTGTPFDEVQGVIPRIVPGIVVANAISNPGATVITASISANTGVVGPSSQALTLICETPFVWARVQ